MIEVRFKQPLKALLPMPDTDLPMVMDTSELHPSNALDFIVVTLFGIVILVSELHP